MAALHDRKVVAALLLLAAIAATAQETPPAYRLGDGAAPREYEIRLAIDPAQPTFTGEARVAFSVKAATPIVWMHARKLVIQSVEVTQGERKLDVEVVKHGEDYIGLKAREGAAFASGEASAVFRYSGAIDPISNRGLFLQKESGESYVVSQHEEVEARRSFPCFDEPGFKTPWTLTIDAPARHVVVANTPETGVSDTPDRPGWKRHAFAKSKPLPSYLVALAVGPFDVVDGGVAGRNRTPLRYLTPKGRASDARYAKEATPRILELLEDYFGMPYPFEKLDSLALPGNYNFGAMENAGLITYGVSILLATPAQDTPRFRRGYVGTGAHEIAHMWFGDFVTLAWWDDLWLNESFASWLGGKTTFQFNPEWDTGGSRAVSRGRAIETDRLASSRSVRNPVNSKEDLEGAFNSITYQKGSAVLEMFETWLGQNEFRAGVRDYMTRHAWGSATAADFFGAIGAASGRGPEALKAFEAFVDQSGVPLVDLELACSKEGAALQVSQQRLRPKGSTAGEREWTTPACFRHDAQAQCETIANAPRSIPLPGRACPGYVLGNAGGSGYYVVRYGPAAWKRIIGSSAKLPAPEAAALLGDTALLAESGLVPIETALELADVALAHRSAVVQLGAARLLDKIPDAWLTEAQAKKKRSVIVQRLQPLAKRIGWIEKPADSYDVIELRLALMPLAARSEGGAPLRADARRVAVKWMRDRTSLSSTMVPPVLDTAARFADRANYELLESLAATTKDGLEQRRIYAALAKVRDPALRARAFGLMSRRSGGSDVMSGREASLFLKDALEDEANRIAAFDYLRANFDAIAAKVAPSAPGRFPQSLRGLCRSSDRDAFVAFFKDRAPRYEGGRRSYDEALEAIDLCIAARA